MVRVTAAAARLFQDMGAEVEETDLTMEEPFPAFFAVFATATYASYGHLLEENGDDLTDYVRNTFEHAARLTAVDLSRALLGVDQLRRQMGNLLRQLRPALDAHHGGTGFPHRPAAIGYRRQRGEPLLGLPAFYLPHQYDRTDGLQRALRFLGRRYAHRPAHRRPSWCRGESLAGVGRL